MTGIAYVDGPRLQRSLLAAAGHVSSRRAELNGINVFPVPDGDTGTNLALTLRAVAERLEAGASHELPDVAGAAAEGAVLGARGNSGMLLAHFMLGLAEAVAGQERVGPPGLAAALAAGARAVEASLQHAVEGTIVTVIRDTAAEAVRDPGTDFVPLLERLVATARSSLARTPDLLPVLAEAGVVDAGAQGFVHVLEGVLHLVHGEGARRAMPARVAVAAAAVTHPATSGDAYRFCTEALVRGERMPSGAVVREELGALGDSVLVVRTGDLLKVHLHTDEPERAFALLRRHGRLVSHKAEDTRAQHEALGRSANGRVHLARRPVAVVTDSACDLPEDVIRAHGIHVAPLQLVEGDRAHRDGIDITAVDFHRRLEGTGPLPTTSQPTPGAFLEVFERAAEEAEAIVAVLLASVLSGTFASAQAATKRVEGAAVRVVDSAGASLLQGLLTLKAAELAELAWGPDRIVAELTRVRARSGILFTIETFDRLLASGRVTHVKALLGRATGLKPILELTPEGRVESAGRAFGRARAPEVLLRLVRARIDPAARRVRFGVVHVGLPGIVEEIETRLRAEYGVDVEILSGPATPVLATHLGLGAWGVAYMVED